jgi:hypothetical protein
MDTTTVAVPIPQPSYEQLARLAEERHQSVADLLSNLATEFLETTHADLANFAAVEEAYSLFPGEFVAIRNGAVLAHGSTATEVLQSVQDRLGLAASEVLLAKADFPDLRIRHPRLPTT